MKKYTVYKIINNVNNKVYIGCHITENLNDNYMGSGNMIKRAIKKYGLENFTKEYIKIFDNPEDMYELESTLVNENFVKNENTYNLKEGGLGGFTHIHDKLENDENFKKEFSETMKQVRLNMIKLNGIEKDMQSIREGFSKYLELNGGTFSGKRHTDESKRKIGEKNKINQLGSNNSVYGTCWIYNDNEKISKRIKKDNLESWISKGWKKGRKMIF